LDDARRAEMPEFKEFCAELRADIEALKSE
jgi:hypothetical protein